MQQNQINDPKGNQMSFEAFTNYSVLTGHTNVVMGIDICGHRNLLASGADDQYVKLWNLENNSLLKSYYNAGVVFDVVFSNQGNLLAFGGRGNCFISLIDISDLMQDKIIAYIKCHKNSILKLTFSNYSNYLISGSYDKKITFFDVIQKKESFQLIQESKVYSVAISSDDKLLASNSRDGNIRIWTIQNKKIWCNQPAHNNGAGIKFLQNQKILVSSGKNGVIKLWSFQQFNRGKLLLIRQFKVGITCIRTVLFSPCSQYLITISNQARYIKVLNKQTGEIVKKFKSKATNSNRLVQVAISKDMKILAYGEDNNIAVWRQI